MLEKVGQFMQFKNILRQFPSNMKFCFAYGSGVFKQKNDPSSNMLDLIFVTRNPYQWHSENLVKNPDHYAQHLRLLGDKAIVKLQESWGAKIFYNTLVKTNEGREIKYGVISEVSLVEDLLDWNSLYLSGRLHKPVEVLVEPDENSQLRTALVQNLHSAVHASLLLLPEHFSEVDFYKTITGLSYNGDFRMTFGEDKSKISNIVRSSLNEFKELYNPILKHFDQYVYFPKPGSHDVCHQDVSADSKIHHLNQLPRTPQFKLVRAWSLGPRSKDTEDCLRAIAHDPDSCDILDQCLREIVWRSSVSQSLKGIFTVGFVKSARYSAAKITKMMQSVKEAKKPPLPIVTDEVKNSVTNETVVDPVTKPVPKSIPNIEEKPKISEKRMQQ